MITITILSSVLFENLSIKKNIIATFIFAFIRLCMCVFCILCSWNKNKGTKRISLASPAGQGGKNASFGASSRASLNLSPKEYRKLFSKGTKAIVWGMQTRAVQSMLDFDFICRREEPSVVAMVSFI